MLALLLVSSVAALITLNLWMTWRIARDAVAFPAEKLGQLLLVWCLPIIGGVLANHLLRNELDRPSGRYREEGYAGGVIEGLQDSSAGQDGSDV